MILFFVFFACPKPTSVITTTPKENSPQKEISFDDPQLNSGVLRDGVFSDYVFPFTAHLSPDWGVIPQAKYSSCRLKVQHNTEPITVEVWRFREITTKPVMHAFCDWKFIDEGIYDRSAEKYIVATCIPKDDKSPYVFAYIRHWKGTWQFEVHVPQQKYIEGKRKAEQLISHFYWNDGEPVPVLKP